ncbi:MAG: histidine phosphatase family protein [Pedobacter sp.]|nr:MAG: histidine phosphatase family protein [Pedobacter sp.]
MAKKLLIVRHGKAAHGSIDLQDILRDLTADGNTSSIAVAEKLLQKGEVPELLVSSNAKRALKTAQFFAATWNIPKDSILIQPKIYEASVSILLSLIEAFNDEYDFIAIFGHNPGFTDLVNYLSDEQIFELPTSSATLLTFDQSSWAETSKGLGKLFFSIAP